MKITTEHPASSYGIPVILDDDGNPLDYKSGIQAVRALLDLSQREFAEKIGLSARTVQDWEIGRCNPSAAALNAMSALLKPKRAKRSKLDVDQK